MADPRSGTCRTCRGPLVQTDDRTYHPAATSDPAHPCPALLPIPGTDVAGFDVPPSEFIPEADPTTGEREHSHPTGGAWNVTRWQVPGCPACAPATPDAGDASEAGHPRSPSCSMRSCGQVPLPTGDASPVRYPSPCGYRMHGPGDTCDCKARLAQVTTHTRTSTPQGPDFCEECSDAVSEWVQWPCPASTSASGCACVGYAIRTDYGTGTEHDVDRSSCPVHSEMDDAEFADALDASTSASGPLSEDERRQIRWTQTGLWDAFARTFDAVERIVAAREAKARAEAWEVAAQRRSEARRYYLAWQNARARALVARAEAEHWRGRFERMRRTYRERFNEGLSSADWHAKHCAAAAAMPEREQAAYLRGLSHGRSERDDEAERQAPDEVIAGVRAWCAINEIAAPPLDWAGLGEFLDRQADR